jgi:hypothetical protein
MKKYTCLVCEQPKFANEYYQGLSKVRKNPRYIRQTLCKKCMNDRAKLYHKNNPHIRILTQLREREKKRGLKSNMTSQIVKELISQPCFYCGRTGSSISLDRVDNSRGYDTDNVNPCCLLCNVIKRDLPYKAWMLLAPGMREARRLGYLDTWVDSTSNRNGIKFS